MSRGFFKKLFSDAPSEDFDARLERLEKTIKMLEIEWNETYDKFRLLHMRVAKRVQRLDASPDEGTTQRVEGDSSGSESLSDRQTRLQQQILARRNRMGGSGGLLHG